MFILKYLHKNKYIKTFLIFIVFSVLQIPIYPDPTYTYLIILILMKEGLIFRAEVNLYFL